ncbi:MAG: hypothetical protein JWO09_3384 [Bacteroidetes bacterium]|nr:hypothetical protein [Bacteroidota bacterium]
MFGNVIASGSEAICYIERDCFAVLATTFRNYTIRAHFSNTITTYVSGTGSSLEQ